MKLHLDTYHMNIEEKDFYTPLLSKVRSILVICTAVRMIGASRGQDT